MNLRPGRRGGPRAAGGERRSSDAEPRSPRFPAGGRRSGPRGGGRGGPGRAGGQRGPGRSRSGSGAGKAGCGRSPLRHPPAASTAASAALRARRDSPAPTPGAREPRDEAAGGAESRAGRPGPRSAPGPGAALGARAAGAPGRGMGPGGGPGLGSRTPPVPRAVLPPPPPRARHPGPSPLRARAPARAARVTSGQVQRDVLLAAVIPPCAKHTHSPG